MSIKSIEYLTQKEHAERLGLSRQTIYNTQKKAVSFFKTVKFNKREYYVWENGRPVLISRGGK
jgi:predicted DNA-binding transcriptional regulator AlpA